jgi:hypothetical protein
MVIGARRSRLRPSGVGGLSICSCVPPVARFDGLDGREQARALRERGAAAHVLLFENVHERPPLALAVVAELRGLLRNGLALPRRLVTAVQCRLPWSFRSPCLLVGVISRGYVLIVRPPGRRPERTRWSSCVTGERVRGGRRSGLRGLPRLDLHADGVVAGAGPRLRVRLGLEWRRRARLRRRA